MSDEPIAHHYFRRILDHVARHGERMEDLDGVLEALLDATGAHRVFVVVDDVRDRGVFRRGFDAKRSSLKISDLSDGDRDLLNCVHVATEPAVIRPQVVVLPIRERDAIVGASLLRRRLGSGKLSDSDRALLGALADRIYRVTCSIQGTFRPLDHVVEELKHELVVDALRAAHFNVRRTARLIGVSPGFVYAVKKRLAKK